LSIIGVQQIDRIVEVVEETLKGNCVRILGQKKEGRIKLGGSALSLADTHQVKKRTKSLTELFNSYLPYENRIGHVYDVLVTEISHDKQYYVAHNKFYEQILVPKLSDLMGKWARVKIVSYCKHSMTGEIVSYNKTSRLKSIIQHFFKEIKNYQQFLVIFFILSLIIFKLMMMLSTTIG